MQTHSYFLTQDTFSALSFPSMWQSTSESVVTVAILAPAQSIKMHIISQVTPVPFLHQTHQ